MPKEDVNFVMSNAATTVPHHTSCQVGNALVCGRTGKMTPPEKVPAGKATQKFDAAVTRMDKRSPRTAIHGGRI